MPSISGLRLNIGPGRTPTRRTVTVSYTIRFSVPEAMAGSVFRERVVLRGDDPVYDDHIITLRSQWVRAQAMPINRTITRQVSRSALDEDPDTVIFGIVLGDRDEIYARVQLIPFGPSGTQADSNLVTGQFGPAGG